MAEARTNPEAAGIANAEVITGDGTRASRNTHPSMPLVVTCGGLAGGRRTSSAVRRAPPHAHVRGTSFRGVLRVDAVGDPCNLAERATGSCRGSVGRVTGVLAGLPSESEALVEAGVAVGLAEVAPGESFAFWAHKRGAYGYADTTPTLERAVGGARLGRAPAARRHRT